MKNTDKNKFIGLYWLKRNFSGFILVHKELYSMGEKYLNWIISSKNHYTFWDEMYVTGKVPGPDYDAYPRGRVSFNSDTGMFTVYHGNWLTLRIRTMLLQEFNLKKDEVLFEEDAHYRFP